MESYEFALLSAKKIDKKKSIKLSSSTMAKASALAVKVSNKNGIEKGEFGEFTTYKITNRQINSISLNLFGVKLTKTSLGKNKTKGWNICDAYLLKDGTPVVYYFDGETELDYKKIGFDINKINDGKYIVNQTAYFGYWGNNDGKPNYKLSYQIEKNKKSSYGYIITKMIIAPIVK